MRVPCGIDRTSRKPHPTRHTPRSHRVITLACCDWQAERTTIQLNYRLCSATGILYIVGPRTEILIYITLYVARSSPRAVRNR